MPPKRRAAAAAPAAPPAKAPAPRASKLAKEHGINGAQEAEIKEAFALFKDPESSAKDPYMPTPAVRRAMAALNLNPSPSELRELLDAADPESEGIVSYEAFLAVAALRMTVEEGEEDEDDDDDDNMDVDEEDEGRGRRGKTKGSKGKGTARGQQEEIEHAFQLFTGGDDGQGVITFAHLKRIAKDLKEDINDDLLRSMMKEASGGTRGVTLQEFEGVMRRAGVFR